MVKRIILTIYGILGVGVILLLVFLNIDSFVASTNRLSEILKIDSLKNFFEVYNENSDIIFEESMDEIGQAIDGAIEHLEEITNKPFGEIVSDMLINALDFSFNFFIYFCNYGLNGIFLAYMMLHETFTGEHLEIRTTPLAYLVIKLDQGLLAVKMAILRAFRWVWNQILIHRRFIALNLILVFSANGYLYRFIVEALIFFIVYVIRMINLETYLVVFSFIRSVFIFSYPKLKYIPLWLALPILMLLIFLKAVSRGNYKLKLNHERLKKFASDDLTQTTFINGAPGTGKTLLNVSLSLASEENYIELMEKLLLDYELRFKYLNFANVRRHPDEFPQHQEYIDIYRLLSTRGTYLISNYAIYSPYFNEYSKIFNFDYMRVNKPTDIYPLEEYIVVSLSEFDKEYNSHDDKKLVGEDGAATFFSTVSHNLKRHVKIFVDYQLKDQVPLRIRGNAEYFLTIKEREKKYPFLLSIYYFPFKIINRVLRYYIKMYELKKRKITRSSMRKSVALYKRNDITLPYAMLRSFASFISKICKWFDSFYYFKMTCSLSQEGEDGGIKKKLCINIRDLSYRNQNLYDSTFLSYAYAQKKNMEFAYLDRFTDLSPSIEELDKCNSRFYDKINNQSEE